MSGARRTHTVTLDVADVERDVAEALATRDWERAATLALKGYGPQLHAYLRGVLRDDDLAADAYSRLSEKVWRCIPEFRGDSTFATWAYRLAWYATRELKRGLARRRERRLATGELSQVAAQARDTTPAYLRADTRDRWAKLRESLDPEERSLLLLRIDRRLPWKDVVAVMAAEHTPANEAALRKRLERLRAKLQTLFREHGLR